MLLVPGVNSIHGNVAQSILGGHNAIIIPDRMIKIPPGWLKIYNETSGEWEYVAPGLQGATGPQGATGVGTVGATGPAYTLSVSSTTSASSLTPNATDFDMYAYNASSRPGRLEGGEAFCLKGVFKYFERRFGG